MAEKPKREVHTEKKGSPSIKISLTTLCLFFVFFEYIQAKEPLLLSHNKDSYDLSKHIHFLEDKNNQFNFKQILQSSTLQKSFAPLPKGDTNFGLSLSTFWFKLELHNKDSKKEHYLLQLDKVWIDHITFFSKDNQKWEKIITGDRHPFKTRPIDHRTFLFPIKPGPKSIYYLKIKSQDTISVPLKLFKESSFYKLEAKTISIVMIYYGMILVMFFYNLLIFFSTRKLDYLYYCLYVASIFLFTFKTQGFAFQYIFPTNLWLQNEGWFVIPSLGGITLTIFTTNYLGLKNNSPRLHKIDMAFFWIFASMLFFPFFRSIYYELSNLTYGILLVGLLTIFSLAAIRLKQGFRPAKYFLLAFSFFIIGLSSTVLNYAGILPDYPIFTNGGYLGSAIEMLLLSLGLADIINSLFEEKTKAEAKLFDLNKTLEEKVKQRTLDLQDALNDISDLLNNMRQSVFTVNKHKKIMKPVSGFSQFIFNEDITGKDIFETVFNSIEKDSELYAKLNFSFGLMFGQDDLQWLMFKDLFPPTLTYAPKNEKYKEKILKFNYNPLFDKEGLLQKMMFVVEDITDILTLEKEMEKQKEEELQNLEILQELASNKKQDLAEYFKDATINEHNILVTSKLFRSKFEKGEKDVDLSSLFRTLHTLKGNSRIYGLSKISQKIHELENPIADIINSDKNDDIIFKINKMNKLIQGTYDLQGITNRYLKSAKEVFAIDFGENLKFKENFHELIKTFEKKLRQLKQASMTLLRPPFEDDDFISLKMAKNQSFFPDFLKSFKEITHSLKGLSRAMDENELSKMIHSLEGSLFSLEKSFLQSNPIDNELESNFFNSFNAIKEKGRKIYIHSPQFEFSSLKIEEVSNLFFKIFQFTEKVISNNQTNKDDLKRIIYQIITFSKDHNFDFINSIGQLIEISLKKRTDRDYVLFYLIKMWHFLSITTTLNSNELKQKRRDQILLVIEHYKENEETSFQFSSNSILERLLDLTSKSYPENGPFYFFEILEKLLEKNGSTEIPFIFMRKENLHETINSLFYKLKGHFKPFDPDPSDDKLSLSFMNSFFILVHPAFPCSYQVSLDLLKILKNYSGADFENEFYERPNIVEVLEENLLHCQKELAGLFQKPTGDLLIILDKNFEKLKEVPVKYSFSKFKKVVIDISKTLGKKVRFHLSGDQASMSNEKLNIIQEALIHLIRNSLDHGVEKPNIRTRYGKNEIGQIGLTIEKRDHETKLILTDDGAGINLEKVTEKALSEGIINLKELEIMSDKDKIDLIFTPNLSTKEKISEISGRGVGMDVVKKNIEKIGGEIKIETVLGESTRFEITIPH